MIRIEHVAIWTNELERMKLFYTSLLDGRASDLYHNESKGFKSYFIHFGIGSRLELMTKEALINNKEGLSVEKKQSVLGLTHLAFALDDENAVDSKLEFMKKNDVTVISEARVTGDGYYECVISDPDGNEVELVASNRNRH